MSNERLMLGAVVRRRCLLDLSVFVGKKVVADYNASNKRIAYAQGVLKSVEGKKVYIEGATRFWVLDIDNVLVLRVTNGDKEDGETGSYLREDDGL